MHDLLGLNDLLLGVTSDISQLHDYLKLLNRYYVEARYPGEQREFSGQDAEEAFGAAMMVKNFVLEKVKPQDK